MSEILHKEVIDPTLGDPIVPHEIPNKKKSPKMEVKDEPKATDRDLFTKVKSREELRLMSADARRKYYKWLRDKKSEKVKCTFRNYETPGEKVSFAYLGFPGQAVETYTFEEGKTYDTPLYVVEHVNKNCSYAQYEHVPGGKTIQLPTGELTNVRIAKNIRRFGLQIIDADSYIQEEYGELLSPIVRVEHVRYKGKNSR